MRTGDILIAAATVCWLAASLAGEGCGIADQPGGNPRQLQRFRQLAAEAQPKVTELMGMERGRDIAVAMVTRQQASRFVDSALTAESPAGELQRLGRCYSEIGLLPRGYDLEAELKAMLHEQAGAYYDPWTKALTGIYGTHGMQDPTAEKMYLSHEMAHAMQDRVADMLQQMKSRERDNDSQYCYRAVIEGMAGAVMVAFAMNKPMDSLPDMRAFWRANLERMTSDTSTFKTLGRAPLYVREWLYSPYAEGGAFIQAWLKANPKEAVATLMKKLPASGEQALHFEKYQANDLPSRIDLSQVRKRISGRWQPFHANSLGEFELRTLFRTHAVTRDSAEDIAGGWDGCRFEAFTDSAGNILMVGSSAWDSEAEAARFQRDFLRVLQVVRGDEGYTIVRNGDRIHFVLGIAGDTPARRLLAGIR